MLQFYNVVLSCKSITDDRFFLLNIYPPEKIDVSVSEPELEVLTDLKRKEYL